MLTKNDFAYTPDLWGWGKRSNIDIVQLCIFIGT